MSKGRTVGFPTFKKRHRYTSYFLHLCLSRHLRNLRHFRNLRHPPLRWTVYALQNSIGSICAIEFGSK